MVVGEASRGGPRMLSEEGFILVVVGSACVLLVLGILELLWPTKPRYPARQGAQGAPPRPADFVTPLRGFEPTAAPRAPIVFAPPPPVSHLPEAEPLEAERTAAETTRAPAGTATGVWGPPPTAEAAPPRVVPQESGPPPETPPPRRMRRSKVSPPARPRRVLRGARKTHVNEAPAPVAPDGTASPKTVEPAARESFRATVGLPAPVPEARTG